MPQQLFTRLQQSHQLIIRILLITLSSSFLPSLPVRAATDTATTPTATVITVNSSEDINPTSLSQTCSSVADGKCTLRRALRQVAATPLADRPIEIRFNLPITDTNKDLEVSGTWTLDIKAALPALLGGSVTIDGNSQPGGRSTGPKIILNTNDDSFSVESEDNVIRNLSIKDGGVIFLKGERNTVEKVWMGLTDDGKSIHFRTPGDEKRMAGGGIFITGHDNIIQDNVIAGAYARAVDVGSGYQNNLIQRNFIGTRADGTVPAVAEAAQCLRSFDYDTQNWYGGWGIALAGSNNKVLNNRIAGLHILQGANDTPPMAIEIFGTNQLIQNNVIGIDSAGSQVGVCGQGIKVAGNGTQILDNIIVGSRIGFEDVVPTAILANDSSPTFGRISVRRNLVGSSPGGIFEFGPGVPALLRNYAPAKITTINGTNVAGSAGDNSPCANCLIDFYSDDTDGNAEALRYLGNTTADSTGNFSFAMTQTLPSGVGIRTSSTSQSAGIIGSYGAGTTTRVSKLYLPMSSVVISGPLTGTVGITYTFTITVSPLGATTPLSYTLNASDYNPGTFVRDTHVLTFPLRWTTAGEKSIDIEVKNELGSVVDTHKITIAAVNNGGGSSGKIYLPLITK